MSQKTNELPYFKTKQKLEEKLVANFLLRKFKAKIKDRFPQHYLVQPNPRKILDFIQEKSKKYPYFLRFDIRFYYPSVSHQILLKKLPEIYQKIAGKPISRRFKKCLKNNLPEFLHHSPYEKGLSVGSRLSWVLAGIFLLGLDSEIKNPFLRQTDDYLILCKNKKEPQLLLKNIILPKLSELGLEINEKKLKSGKFHRDKVDFTGFEFCAGYFRIKPEKVEEFRDKIRKLTYLTKNKPKEAVIKFLNNQILGFGHYYKFASAKKEFEELDASVRMCLRRYIARNKDSKNKEGNLLLTNSVLEKMGLKSLLAIKEKYARKKRHISSKLTKKPKKTGNQKEFKMWPELEEIEFKYPNRNEGTEKRFYLFDYQQKLILAELKQLTGLVKKLERKIANLERKLVKKNDSNS